MMPVLNEAGYLAQAVASIYEQDYPGQMELLLALGPSTDETTAIAEKLRLQYTDLSLIPNPRGLTTVGLNHCIRQARHEIIARVDAHCELPVDYLRTGIAELRAAKADAIGGLMRARGRGTVQRAIAYAYGSRFGLGGGKYHVGGEAGEAESVYLGIFTRDSLNRVAGYDEGVIRGEDWDLSRRIRESGGRVWFSPKLSVTYFPRESFADLARQFYATGVWRGDLTRRNPRDASPRYFAPPALVLALALGLGLLGFGFTIGILPIALYLLLVLGVSLSAPGLSLSVRAALLVALPVMHLSWGLGFWLGIVKGAKATVDRGRVRD